MTRFYHAFKWQTVVDVIKNRVKGIVLIAASNDGDEKILSKLTAEEKGRTFGICDIYSDDETKGIIYAANKPADKTWADWCADCGLSLPESLFDREDTLCVSALILMDHPYRTNNLHKIIAETNLKVISSTERWIKRQAGTDSEGKALCETVPDVSWLYGRPSLPDFDKLTDEVFDLYRGDGVCDLDSLIPVYEFSVQSFSHKQLLNTSLELRAPWCW